jgi:hypothetical protein
MVEIRYGDQFEVSGLAGQTVSEARGQFKAEFGIPNKAQARLNGSKVKTNAELDTVLNDDDKLTFVKTHSRGPYLVGALLLAMAITGGIWAAGFINATTTLTATTQNSNFADVSQNSAYSTISWSSFGAFKGSIGGGIGIFNIAPATGYTGDLVTTVTLGNADQLLERYRVLSLQLEMIDNTGTPLDISAGAGSFFTLLTLDNGSTSLYTTATTNMTVRLKGGFFITQAKGPAPWGGSASPELFCEVAQR